MPINWDFKIQNIIHKHNIPRGFLLKTTWNITQDFDLGGYNTMFGRYTTQKFSLTHASSFVGLCEH